MDEDRFSGVRQEFIYHNIIFSKLFKIFIFIKYFYYRKNNYMKLYINIIY